MCMLLASFSLASLFPSIYSGLSVNVIDRHGAIYSNDIILKVQYAVIGAREMGGCEVVQ